MPALHVLRGAIIIFSQGTLIVCLFASMSATISVNIHKYKKVDVLSVYAYVEVRMNTHTHTHTHICDVHCVCWYMYAKRHAQILVFTCWSMCTNLGICILCTCTFTQSYTYFAPSLILDTLTYARVEIYVCQ
jgi:hypothetical protein